MTTNDFEHVGLFVIAMIGFALGTGFICDDGFMWLNTALAWMYCEVPEPYKPTVPPECEGDCGWCKTSVIEKCKEVTT